MRAGSGWLGLALIAAFLTVLFRMGSLPLLQPDEGRNAEVAREMKVRGGWLVPTYNDLAYLDKPAFYFKTVALSLAAFGDHEFAARIPSAAFAIALLGLVWAFCRRVLDDRIAALAVLVIATNPLFISQARTVIFDIALGFFTCAAIFAGYWAEEAEGRPRRNRYLVGAVAAGGATLVKGPVGFLIPILVLTVFNLLERRPAALKRLFAPGNVLLFLAVVLPWFIGLSVARPDFPYYGLVEESFHRFTTAKFHRTAPFYYYLLVLPATFFPWSLLLPETIFAVRGRWRSLAPVSRLAIVWSLVVVVFFSLSQSKLPGYILSVTVPFGILVAQVLNAAFCNESGRAAKIVHRASLILGVAAGVLLVALLIFLARTQEIAALIRLRDGNLADFSSHAIPMIALAIIIGLLAAWAGWRKNARVAVISLAALAPLLIVLGHGIFLTVYEGKSARNLAARVAQVSPQAELGFYRCFPNGLPFYLGRTGTLITPDGGELTSNYAVFALARDPKWPTNIVPVDHFDSWLGTRATAVYLIAKEEERTWLTELARRRGAAVDELPQKYLGALLPPAKTP